MSASKYVIQKMIANNIHVKKKSFFIANAKDYNNSQFVLLKDLVI